MSERGSQTADAARPPHVVLRLIFGALIPFGLWVLLQKHYGDGPCIMVAFMVW
jgi:hypothetical protein